MFDPLLTYDESSPVWDEVKGGKPSKGTTADQRLKDNKPDGNGGKKPPAAAPPSGGKKPAFPGAAQPFKKKP